MSNQVDRSSNQSESLSKIPVVGGSLAKAREATECIRPQSNDSKELRVAKRTAQVVATVATGAVGALVIW